MGKPYIEYQNKIYEFEASMPLKIQYDKDKQALLLKKLKESEDNYTVDQLKDMEAMAKAIQEKKITEKEVIENKELQNKMVEYANIINTFDATQVDFEYMFKMLNAKYSMKRDEFDKMMEELGDEWGRENLSFVANKVCEKVFMQKVEEIKAKKTLPKYDYLMN